MLRKSALALAAAPLVLPVLAAPALAQSGGTTYQASLDPLNHASGSGHLTLSLHGNEATIDESVSGLASTFAGKPYPHVQHIHINADGVCPTMSADKNGDGVVSTAEGQPSYGPIGTTLSVHGGTSPASGTDVTIAPSGADFSYHRTITLDSATLDSVTGGVGVIVVHGLDPSTLSKKAQGEKSELVPALPLAATSPALCGELRAIPAGGAGTGGGGTAGTEDVTLLVLGGALVAAAGGSLMLRRAIRN